MARQNNMVGMANAATALRRRVPLQQNGSRCWRVAAAEPPSAFCWPRHHRWHSRPSHAQRPSPLGARMLTCGRWQTGCGARSSFSSMSHIVLLSIIKVNQGCLVTCLNKRTAVGVSLLTFFNLMNTMHKTFPFVVTTCGGRDERHKFTRISCSFGMMRAAFRPALPATHI